EENSTNIEHHILLCRAVDLPPDIPTDPNPREQKTDKGIYKDVKNSLLNEKDLTFHLKNKGVTIIAHEINYSTNRDAVEISFKDGEGIVDGAHTCKIILENQTECPSNQFVKLEVLTGVPKSYIELIAEGLNTAVVVQAMSLANLSKDFDWVKAILDTTPYGKKIAYKENVDAEFDIRDIVGLMTLFNVDLFPDATTHPKVAYISKARALDTFLGKEDGDNDEETKRKRRESFKKLAPILKDILQFHDYVHLKAHELYNREYLGKARKLAFYQTRKRGKYTLIFSNTETGSMLYDGALYPILGAFRYLVEKNPGTESYSWKVGSFENVKKLFDKVGAQMIYATKNTSDSRGRNPNAIGKDDSHWDNLYKTVALAYLEGSKN
ncbi:MAG: AIPR family protein, partial [Candidatus Zixiibacteriota bacterium]